jgi:hypothetical protein
LFLNLAILTQPQYGVFFFVLTQTLFLPYLPPSKASSYQNQTNEEGFVMEKSRVSSYS